MSRLPQPSSRSGAKSPFTKPSSPSPSARATPTPLAKPRVRTQSAAPVPSPRPQTTLRSKPSLKNLKPPRSPTKSPARRTTPLPPDEDVPPTPPLPQLSIREQIALKRAEVKKVVAKPTIVASASGEFAGLEDASPHTFNQPSVVDVDLGRWSIKETIERGRSSGAINLSSRDLPCLPSALFEIHLGIKPEPLKSVPVEPPITTASSTDFLGVKRKGSEHAPSWYEAQDLEILKAWSNEILELQPELSMFGSLKVVDLHNNKLTTLPDSFADLTALTNVDLSQNELTSLPTNFWTLPNITHLNLSHNALTALPFSAPFAKEGANPLGRTRDTRGDFFATSISRATEPLPRLTTLEVSHNHLSAVSIDHDSDGSGFPALLSKLDLSENPLGRIDSLMRSLGRLARLKELHMQRADIGDESFPVSVFATCSGTLFPALKVLDLEETHVTLPAIEATFTPNVVKQTLQFDLTNQEPPDGVLRVILGKRVVKESWEIEAERRAAVRRRGAAGPADTWSLGPAQSNVKTTEATKEPWEIEAEQGLLTEGAKRRMRAQATANAQSSAASSNASQQSTAHFPSQKKPVVVQKEQWEIDAEQGLLSVGARRRARAEAVAAAASKGAPSNPAAPKTPSPTGSPAPAHTPSTVASALASPQYYSAPNQTLTLPSSAPPSKAAHARSFSLASPAWGKLSTSVSELALAIPTPTLPLSAIAAQPLAQTLKVLILTGRRNDPSFSLPAAAEAGLCLPWLEELSLENCNLPDNVPVSRAGEDGADDFGQRTNEPLLPLLAKLFPSVRTLDLSYNALTSAALGKDALSALILADTPAEDGSVTRKGLRHLRLRGNRLGELDGFQEIAERFRGNREVPEWKLEELDLRDNEIGKLPPELGMLPLDVFLVDGNVFRIPARRVWEREGTKGLLSWLRGRME
ncbi:L domain-like protein [Trametes versicolor FP-101664 SS1]|uniref:L domain-like protein n=1 Tax=Trametes versicolor (strain FP-101664) TaxID=717944 RepID=UPI0004622DF8|nr:L domain-like protein [Trametes versicolor FP-101664 SS1]EIW57151.1 L domain-like protein [Trametes versicolor FP-101664 SS1]